jgi:hypothetical protein
MPTYLNQVNIGTEEEDVEDLEENKPYVHVYDPYLHPI